MVFQFENIINVLETVNSSRFIWIPMLYVFGHYNQIMPSKDGSRKG